MRRGNRRKAFLHPMSHLTRLAAAAASNGLLTGQVLFSLAFVGGCELPNWIAGPRQVNACLERWMTVSALFFPSGVRSSAGLVGPVMAAGRRGMFR